MNKQQQESKFDWFNLSIGVCSIILTSTKVVYLGFEKKDTSIYLIVHPVYEGDPRSNAN